MHRGLADRNGKHRSRIDISQITAIAEHVSMTERIAADAEIESAQMKKLEFFQRQLDEHNPQIFRAAIVDVRNYGLAVELPDALLTGLVHVSSLTDDFYLFEPARRQLIGRRSRKRFSVGDEVRVFVVRVDSFKRQVDFAIASDLPIKIRSSKRDPRLPSSSGGNRPSKHLPPWRTN